MASASLLDWEVDPENPRNWSLGKKWASTAIVSLYTFVSPLASSIMAGPGLAQIAEHETVIDLTLSIFLISFGVAPLFLASLSETYGRYLLHISNIVTIRFSLGCAFSPTTGAPLIFRLLSRVSGSAPLACGDVISDLFSERDRAAAMTIYSLGRLIGPGFVVESIGLKLVETYAPLIRLRLAEKHADPEKAALEVTALANEEHSNKLYRLWINLSRPAVMQFGSSVCFLLSLYMAFMYGIYYLMFTTFSALFSETYRFSIGIGGLTYLGLGAGFMLVSLAKKNGGQGEPEMRIPGLIFGSLFVPIGLLRYGWSAAEKVHAFSFLFSIAIQLYLVDTFEFAASALSAASEYQSMFIFLQILPTCMLLSSGQMFAVLGRGSGNSLLAGLAIILGIPFPIYLCYRGAAIRAKSSLSR
ncbi:major facilitator superfamily domain-containing protein [Mycena galopus ATCC 62051]|nr:major facilitator superfamily domain-containing protein [Mycena galopus ATCC 62051]